MKSLNLKNSGFTLVELAIGLTIISVVAGGVMQGNKLVGGFRAASVTSSFEQYKIAHTEFKKQYQSLPGDFGEASAIWTGAVNGNDNNKIEYTSNNAEQFAAWQHLGKAKLIEVEYSGSGGNTMYRPGINIPVGTHAASGFRMFTRDLYIAGQTDNYCGKKSSFLTYSKFEDGCTTCEDIPIITPSEAYAIDRKIDDGVPTTGNLYGMNIGLLESPGAGNECYTGIGKYGEYAVNNNAATCLFYYAFQSR